MAELQVSRKNIAALLSLSDSTSADKTYVIPEYQRPYRWGETECDTLWTDIKNFYIDKKSNPDGPKEYFIGTIVTCTDAANKSEIDIIDGQQRITSLLLLLRAFYLQLEISKEEMPEDEDIQGLMSQIEPCIWRIDKMSRKVKDRSALKIDSRVALDKDNSDFKAILSTGKELTTESAYAKNYSYFLKKCREFASNNAMAWKNLCLTILDECIVFPIECEDLNSALTIFSTLNNRGLPLSDSDIFKAELYKLRMTPQEKTAFTDDWKALEEKAEEGGFSINDVFRFYTHVIRASQEITDNEQGLRRFYAGADYKYSEFKKSDFFTNIVDIADFWLSINNNISKFDQENNFCNLEAIKLIHCLANYPNDYWRCIVTVFYIKHRGEVDFKNKFEAFLRHLLAYMLALFIMKPQVNAVKPPTYKFCIDIYKTGDAIFKYDLPKDFAVLMEGASKGSSKIVKSIILLNTYLYDPGCSLITGKLEIEHILPKKWKESNYFGWTKETAQEHLESFGNKIPFEKRLNIQAGNGYFGEKKNKYIKSPIKEVQDLASLHSSNDWLPEDIEKRRDELCNRVIDFFVNNLTPTIEPEKVEELMNLTRGNESITLQKISGNGIVTYKLISIRNIANPTPLQALSGSIPVETRTVEHDNLSDVILAIDFNFMVNASTKVIAQEFQDYLSNMNS